MKALVQSWLVAGVFLCATAGHVWAQAAAPALPGVEDLARSAVSIESVTGPRGSGSGVYALFASPTAVERLQAAGLTVADNRFVYVGRTDRSFRTRLWEHLSGRGSLSESVRSILRHCAAGLRCPAVRPGDVSQFMRANFRIAMVPLNDAAASTAAERRYIRAASPVLNLDGVDNANSRRLHELRRRLGTPVRSAVLPNVMKGARIGALIEMPVGGIVGYLDVRNGRKTPGEALRDGAATVGAAVATGAAVAGGVAAGAAAGVTIPGIVAAPAIVAGSVYYVYYATGRIWNALDEDARAELEQQFAATADRIARIWQGGDRIGPPTYDGRRPQLARGATGLRRVVQ